MGLNELKIFIETLFNNNNNKINDKYYKPNQDLLPLIINGTLPAINEICDCSMTTFQKDIMYNNIAKRCTFLKLNKGDKIIHNIDMTDENTTTDNDDLLLILSGSFKLINYKYYNKREEKYMNHNDCSVDQIITFNQGDYISKPETKNLLRYLPQEEKKEEEEIDWRNYTFDDENDKDKQVEEILLPTFQVISNDAIIMKIPRPILRCGNLNVAIFHSKLLPELIDMKKKMEQMYQNKNDNNNNINYKNMDDLLYFVIPAIHGILSKFLLNIFPTMTATEMANVCQYIEYNVYPSNNQDIIQPIDILNLLVFLYINNSY